MNQRNVAALEMLLREHCRAAHCKECDCVESAQFLASHGALVPSALTDDEAIKIGADAAGVVPIEPAEIALCVRQSLAKVGAGRW